MATEHTATGEHSQNGVSGAPKLLTRDEWHEQQKAAFLAGDDTEVPDPKPARAVQPKPARPAHVEEPDDDLDEPAATVSDLDEDDDLEPDMGDGDLVDDDDDLDEPEDEAGAQVAKSKADPELAKRLAAVRATEQRQRAALQREREELLREREEFRSQAKSIREAQDRFDRLAARAKYNPVAVLRELGLTDDDFEHAGQVIYAHSKAAGLKPETKAAAERAMRERESMDELAQLRAKHEALEKRLAERDELDAADRQVRAFMGRVYKAAGDETPLTKKYLAKNPAAAQAALTVTANRLAQKLGSWPKPEAVVRAYEKQRRRDLADLDIDVPLGAGAKKPHGAPAPSGATQKNGAAPAAAGNGLFPSRDEVIAELEGGDFD